MSIHSTALISAGARIAEDVTIGPYCVIDDGVTIGRGCVLGAFVRLYGGVTLDEEVQVFENVTLGAPPQDRGYQGEESFVHIGARTQLRENVTVHRPTGQGNVTSVGRDCLIMEGVHLAHNVTVGNEVTIASKAGLAGHVKVGDYTVIGGLAGVHQNVRIGAYCMVGGASKTTQDVPPFTLIDASPSRIYSLNSVGLRRRGFSAQDRSAIKECYKTIYAPGQLLRQGLEEAKSRFGSVEACAPIFAFFEGENHNRGFVTWPLRSKNED